MFRVRIRLPRGREISYTNVDVVKDAAINMLEAAGADAPSLMGPDGRQWGAAPVCRRYIAPKDGRGVAIRKASEIIVSTPDPVVAAFLAKADPSRMVKVQPSTGETVDMTGAEMIVDHDPILVSRQEGRVRGRWHSDVRGVDISAAVSRRLTTLAGRPVNLAVDPDALYLSGRKTHSVCVDVKTNGGKQATVVGMVFPFTLCGSPEDLRLAWYAGIGERNRLGFGFFGSAA